MRGGLALVVLAAALGAAACSGGGEAGRASADSAATETGATTGGATETTDERTVEQRPATREEVAWVGRLVDWSLTIAEPVEAAGSAIEPLGRRRTLSAKARAAVAKALVAIRRCPSTYEQVAGDAPSERLQDVAELMRDACDGYAQGAEYGAKVLRDGSDTTALEDWIAAWTNADKLLSSSSDVFADYQPSNLKKLRTRSGQTHATRVEPVFTSVARAVTASGDGDLDEPEARCWSEPEWKRLIAQTRVWSNGRVNEDVAGFTGFRDYRMNLAPYVCDALVDLHYRHHQPTDAEGMAVTAFGVQVLVHEAQHARGVLNEASAECYGMQRLRDAARRLGASPAYASDLAAFYWTRVYPLAPEGYRSDECRPGGALDAFPKQDRWP